MVLSVLCSNVLFYNYVCKSTISKYAIAVASVPINESIFYFENICNTIENLIANSSHDIVILRNTEFNVNA